MSKTATHGYCINTLIYNVNLPRVNKCFRVAHDFLFQINIVMFHGDVTKKLAAYCSIIKEIFSAEGGSIT